MNEYSFHVKDRCSKLGVMFVGLAGNNATTFLSAYLSKKYDLTWETKSGEIKTKLYGSIAEYGAFSENETYKNTVDFNDDIVIRGWDIDDTDIYDAIKRNMVIEPSLRKKLKPYLSEIKCLPSVYYEGWLSSTQNNRIKQVISYNSNDKQKDLDTIRCDIRAFKNERNFQKIIVFWTASTERNSKGNFDTAENILKSVSNNDPEISPSMIFAIAACLEGCIFVNGSPQNTITKGIIELAKIHGSHVVGNDLKTGQTKFKSVITDFLVKSGIKPLSIVSYNHLGNNDGLNLSSQEQFNSKEISKRDVISDIVENNPQIFEGNSPEHTVVIKYIKTVGDDKRAIDEYVSELMLDGRSIINVYNICQDSLLAVGVMYDIILFSEFLTRIIGENWNYSNKPPYEYGLSTCKINTVLSYLNIFFKAPIVNQEEKLVNTFFDQYKSLDTLLRKIYNKKEINYIDFENRFNFIEK